MNTIFLYILIAGSAGTEGTYHWSKSKMPDMKTCLDAVKNAKTLNSNGHENETALAMYCGTGETKKYYGGKWWSAEEK
jgi:hypothetical protein